MLQFPISVFPSDFHIPSLARPYISYYRVILCTCFKSLVLLFALTEAGKWIAWQRSLLHLSRLTFNGSLSLFARISYQPCAGLVQQHTKGTSIYKNAHLKLPMIFRIERYCSFTSSRDLLDQSSDKLFNSRRGSKEIMLMVRVIVEFTTLALSAPHPADWANGNGRNGRW